MARWSLFRRDQAQQPDTTKAVSTAPLGGHTFTAEQVAALLVSSSVGPQVPGGFVPLPRTDPQVAFGPGVPLIPGAIDPLRPDTHRPEPRFNEYPVTSNLPGVGDRLVPWKVLRDAADIGGLARRCIEIRKAEVATLDWAVTITGGAVEAARAADPDRAPSEVETELRERLAPEIARCTAFWQKPDPGQDEDTSEWMSKLLEEHLVLDAVAIYPRRTFGGDLYALEILAGDTIKPLRDHRGGRPLPPQPAYQQILWGFPRGEFTADTDADEKVINGYQADQLVYKRRNVRSFTPYGYSAVEQALEDIDVWLRRRKWIRDEYTEGTVPTGLLRNTGAGGWTPQQVAEYETGLNDMYAGSSGARHRLRVLPPGFELQTQTDVAERYRPDYDLFLIKLIASHFDVTIAELGFTEPGGLGSSGWHEGQADVQQRKGTLPTLRWLQQFCTSMSRKHLSMPPELEFRFLGLEEEGEAAADEVAAARVADGRMTYNEDRDRMGQPRYDFPEADMPLIKTARGLVFLAGASQLAPAGELVGPVQGAPQADVDADGILDAPHGPDTDTGDPQPDSEVAGDKEDPQRADQVKTELGAYRRWARRNPAPARPFQFTTVTKADAPDLVGAPVTFVSAGGDAHPKGGEVAWPGWERDQDAADRWAPRITRALDQAVDCDTLAERRLAHGLTADPDPSGPWSATVAAAWLTDQGLNLGGTIAGLLSGIWAEGWAIGHASAAAVNRPGAAAAFGWQAGDHQGAERTLTHQSADGLAVFRARHQTEATALADGRLKVLAAVLARALSDHWTARKLAVELRASLRDPTWAQMLALTELTRATSAASANTYREAGITDLRWITEPGACLACRLNEESAPVPIGGTWPDGSTAPPAHPNCRCATAPA